MAEPPPYSRLRAGSSIGQMNPVSQQALLQSIRDTIQDLEDLEDQLDPENRLPAGFHSGGPNLTPRERQFRNLPMYPPDFEYRPEAHGEAEAQPDQSTFEQANRIEYESVGDSHSGELPEYIVKHRRETEAARSFDREDDIEFCPYSLLDETDLKLVQHTRKRSAFAEAMKTISRHSTPDMHHPKPLRKEPSLSSLLPPRGSGSARSGKRTFRVPRSRLSKHPSAAGSTGGESHRLGSESAMLNAPYISTPPTGPPPTNTTSHHIHGMDPPTPSPSIPIEFPNPLVRCVSTRCLQAEATYVRRGMFCSYCGTLAPLDFSQAAGTRGEPSTIE